MNNLQDGGGTQNAAVAAAKVPMASTGCSRGCVKACIKTITRKALTPGKPG